MLPPLVQIVIVLVVVGGGFLLFSSGNRQKSAESSSPEANAQPLPAGYFKPTPQQWQGLKIAAVQAIPFPMTDETDGTIAPADDVTTQVFSPYSGHVTDVYAAVGDTVKKGQPLFAVDATEFAQAENDLVAAIRLRDAQSIQVSVTERNRKRLLKLLEADGATQKDVEQSAADLSTAQATLKNDETAVDLVRSRLRILGAENEKITAVGDSAQVSGLPTNVVVPAPITGTITSRTIGLGQSLESAADGASNAAFTITDFSKVYFVAAVREENVATIHIGAPISVRINAFPGTVFTANIKYISPTVDATTHRIAVRAAVENGSGLLKPGMFGDFSITIGNAPKELAVPESAVIFEGNTARVWITGRDQTLALRYIHVGKTADGMVEVLGGLTSNDHVVTSGSLFIDRASQSDG